ncbi:MAG: glycoside hydrolase family 3 N-terminal domain-containing protein [Bacteroidaceae bacterium]
MVDTYTYKLIIVNSNDIILSGETPYTSYTSEIKQSYTSYSDMALIVISRIGGEGFDLPRYSQTSHYLQLTDNEKSLIDNVKKGGFKKIVVVINSNNIMEIDSLAKDDGIDAIFHCAGPGFSGIKSFGKLLNGEISPSAHTVDTWSKDFSKDPSWNNFGNNLVSGTNSTPAGNEYTSNGVKTGYYYVDYEEGIYVGYKYYETRYATETNPDEWYDKTVTYPFGYGLSYTNFDWSFDANSIKDRTINDANKNSDFDISVTVKNTGNAAGKDVVELYMTPNYIDGEIEKSEVNLVAFAKTKTLQPGESDNLTLTVNPYYFASYDDVDKNNNGFMGYELDGGQYSLSLRTDAHHLKTSSSLVNFNVAASGIKYTDDPVTGTPVVNRYDDARQNIDTFFSRHDFDGTWPTMSNTKEFNDEYVTKAMLDSRVTNNPLTYTEMPKTGAPVTKKLIDLKGVSYNDHERWNALLDSLTFDQIHDLYNLGAFSTIAIPSIGKPGTLESDGPVGFTNFMSDSDIYGTVAYASEVVLASTWNVDLLEKMGQAVGEEGIMGKQSLLSHTPYSGWYAPGVNIHRSPFGGRNYEYFSEDSFLTGKLAASEIKGVNSKGVYTFMKHFALNDQETNRDSNGISTWASEQAIREIYLRPFEIAVKEGHSHGIMSSFNRIGTVWTGGDYRLLTEILRNEWGFQGSVISDFNVSGYMNGKQMAYAGGDLNLTTTRPWVRAKSDSAADVSVLRNAAFHTLYTIANSCAMNGIDVNTNLHTATLWKIIMYVIDGTLAFGLLAWGVPVIVLYKKKEKKEVEKIKK